MNRHHSNIALIAMTQDEARVWIHGLDPDQNPILIHASAEGLEHRVHTADYHSGRNKEHIRPEFYEKIIELIKDFDGIVLVGHGKGKARASDHFDQYLTKKHHEISNKIWGSFTQDFDNQSNREILASARTWIAEKRPFVSI